MEATQAMQAARKLGNVRKIDFLMARDRDFAPRPEGARYRYVLCSTPRCGSNLVGEMLHDTGLAGDPHEYLNQRYVAGFLRERGTKDAAVNFKEYQTELETRRTSPNGVFGVKIHYEHLEARWHDRMAQAVQYLRVYDKFVLLTRRDKVAQAVSLHKARESQIWSSLDYKFLDADDPRRAVKPAFNAIRIAKALSDLVEQETKWRQLIESQKFPYVEVCYEDFVADYVGQSHRLLAELGIDPAAAKVTAPGLKKQGAEDDPMIEQFKQLIGVEAKERAA
ncbi:MAG TPA: Stf0 family sulfotransferase [Ramlibacter sp.]|nr:Stf0 family sulfotransferase [Ramlibacter sp.]